MATEIQGWIDQFIEEIETRGLSDITQKAYVSAVTAFFEKQTVSVEDVGLQEIKKYQRYLIKERGLSPNTINRNMSAVKLFYIYVLSRYEYDHLMSRVKVPYSMPIVLTELEVARMIDAVQSVFWKAVLLITYSAGLRQKEVRKLKATDIDSKRMVIYVRGGKGGHDRQAHLSPIALTALRNYWRLYRLESAYKSDLLFIAPRRPRNSDVPKMLSHTAMGHIVKKAAELAGIKKKFTHIFYDTHLQLTC